VPTSRQPRAETLIKSVLACFGVRALLLELFACQLTKTEKNILKKMNPRSFVPALHHF
jgi:hypothetical protein